MNVIHCLHKRNSDINKYQKWSRTMNALKKIGIGLSLVAGTAFASNASVQAKSFDQAKLDSSKIAPAYNMVASNDSIKAVENPVIREGHGGQAMGFSADNKVIAIHISGGNKGEKYTAEQYAKMLNVMFKDTARTEYPTEVYFFYEESGEDRPTGAIAFMSGRRHDWNGGEYKVGDEVIRPIHMVAKISEITKRYADEQAASVISADATASVGFDRN